MTSEWEMDRRLHNPAEVPMHGEACPMAPPRENEILRGAPSQSVVHPITNRNRRQAIIPADTVESNNAEVKAAKNEGFSPGILPGGTA
jgi:hypothetical protein